MCFMYIYMYIYKCRKNKRDMYPQDEFKYEFNAITYSSFFRLMMSTALTDTIILTESLFL